jgi:hypothetical protein
MNPLSMRNVILSDKIGTSMAKWRLRQRFYPDTAQWWERCVKTHLPRLIRRVTRENNDDHDRMENHLYECLNDIICSEAPEGDKRALLQRYKAKIVGFHATRRKKIFLDMHDYDVIDGEEPSLFHVLKTLRRRSTRNISQVKDIHGHICTEPQDITNTFLSHLRRKYEPIHVDSNSITILTNMVSPVNSSNYAEPLESPITSDEVLTALHAGSKHKSAGIDGFCLEFYTANWETIQTDLLQLLNSMFLHNNIPDRQKHGVLICLPKGNGDQTPEGYRPISLLNIEYKLLARRLRPILVEQLRNSQFCGVSGKTILDAISSIRDVIAPSECTETPLCVLTLDFQSAFDRISYDYLLTILRQYGISQWFIDRLYTLYDQATASVQINGHMAGPIPIRSGVRQGCPLSMVLYALCLHPLLLSLENSLPPHYL